MYKFRDSSFQIFTKYAVKDSFSFIQIQSYLFYVHPVCHMINTRRDTVQTHHYPVGLDFPFLKVCICRGNFFGIDCGECVYGWEGKNCDIKSKLRVRKNALHLNAKEKDR